MTITQEKWLRRGIAAVLGIALLCGIVMNTSAFATVDDVPRADAPSTKQVPAGGEVDNDKNTDKNGDNAGSNTKTDAETETVAPTFSAEEDRDNFRLAIGSNLLAFGNEIVQSEPTHGLAVTFGNSVRLENQAKYNFVAGNTVEIAGETKNDVFAAGNMVRIAKDAQISGDVFVAANELTVKSSLPGDLAVTAAVVRLDDVYIAGNLDLSAEKVIFDGDITIGGTLTYNDDITLVGFDNATYQSVETYHVEKTEPSLLTILYGKLFSAVALMIAMLVVILFASRLHEHIEQSTRPAVIISDVSLGAWILLLVPIVAIFLLCTMVGAPLAIVMFVLYLVAIYLSQGFAGAWLGHLLIEKAFKSKSNIFVETLVGILILSALSLVPYLGELTGLFGMLLGLGLMVSYIKPKFAFVKERASQKVSQSKSAKKSKDSEK